MVTVVVQTLAMTCESRTDVLLMLVLVLHLKPEQRAGNLLDTYLDPPM